jgi:tetratricopeptide (TPR) repeat protein
MKNLLTLIATALLSITAYSQKIPQDYFDEGIAFSETEEYDKSIASFKYIVEHYPEDKLYPMALYNTAYLYLLIEEYSNAIPVYEKILASNLKEDDLIGGGIMDNPYANYKYKACRDLCYIYRKTEDYVNALKYLEVSDTTYPYLHFCANEGCGNEFSLAISYAEIYDKTGRKDEGLKKLVTYAFREDKDVLDTLQSLISGKKELKKELDAAIAGLYHDERNGIKYYYIKFLDTEIYVGDEYREHLDPKSAAEKLRASTFYKMVEKL